MTERETNGKPSEKAGKKATAEEAEREAKTEKAEKQAKAENTERKMDAERSEESPATDTYEQFAASLAAYDIEPQRVRPAEVSSVLSAVVTPPAIGVPLPWEDVTLPESVATEPTSADLKAAVTGVTAASLGVASYGSLVLRTDASGSEAVSLFVDRHVAVVREEDIVPDMATAFEWFGDELRETRDSAIIATGPSATADMGTLVRGAHGPKLVEVLVVT